MFLTVNRLSHVGPKELNLCLLPLDRHNIEVAVYAIFLFYVMNVLKVVDPIQLYRFAVVVIRYDLAKSFFLAGQFKEKLGTKNLEQSSDLRIYHRDTLTESLLSRPNCNPIEFKRSRCLQFQ